MRKFLSSVLLFAACIPAAAQMSEFQVGSGLKQALEISASKAVALNGRTDGYFGNPAIKIPLPKNLQTLEKILRGLGLGSKVDEFVLSMNRAAETAAPAAGPILKDAIFSMTLEDVRGILAGGDTAATDYFRRKTTPQLVAAFTPAIKKSMEHEQVVESYNAIEGHLQSLPFGKQEKFDLTEYVVTKALDGLFYEVGLQEKEIRHNPLARTTSLLKSVFGR